MATFFVAILAAFAFCEPADSVPEILDDETDVENSNEDLFSENLGDINSLFDDAEDAEKPVINNDKNSDDKTVFNIGSLSIPLKMSGDISAEIGAAYINEDYSSDYSAYFDFYNYLYFTARPDKYMAVKGSFKTALPSDGDEESQNHYFYLYELYFDYIMADKIYITAGKKNTVWGNIRLFSDDDNYDDSDDDALYTNALYDSRNKISGIIRVPFGLSTLNFMLLYGGGAIDDGISRKDLSYAGSMEFVFFGTSLNFFARLFPSKHGNQSSEYKPPILGAEIKRTLLKTDFYVQALARAESNSTLQKVFKKEFYKKENFSKFVFTGGFYRMFDSFYPNIGINAEFQSIYYPVNSYKYGDDLYIDTDDLVANLNDSDKIKYDSGTDLKDISSGFNSAGSFYNRFIVDFGLSKLGPDRNMKVGIQWQHSITQKSGYVNPVFVISRVFPHCDWRTGVKWEYWEDQDYFGKITLGTYLKFTLDY